MGDLCMCGHEEREHQGGTRECWHHNGDHYACSCCEYRRSPLSAFRGAMQWTRRDAARAFVSLFRGYEDMAPPAPARNERVGVVWLLSRAASAVTMWGAKRRSREARRMLTAARAVVDGGEDIRGAQALLVAARILRAVRP